MHFAERRILFMKIWIINHSSIPPSMGGLVRHYYLSKYLQKNGHGIKIFTSGIIHNTEICMVPSGKLFYEENIEGVPYVFVKGIKYKSNGLKRILNILEFPFRVFQSIRWFEKPDIIYTSSPDIIGAWFAIILAKRIKVRCVLEIRDLYPETLIKILGWSRKNPVAMVLSMIETWIYKKADTIVFTMEGGLDYIKKNKPYKNIDFSKIHHLNNGIDLEERVENLKRFRVDDEDLNDDKINIIYAGSIRRANNMDRLVKCAELLMEHSEIRFLIYGSGTDLENLKAYCKTKGIDNIKFKGFVDKKYLPFILSKGYLNIMNYSPNFVTEYGCSQNKLFEYMASGKPILSNIKMNYDLIERYKCGISDSIKDAEDYKDAVLNFVNMDKETYKKMCANCLEAVQLYDYKILAEKLEEILQDCMSK